MAVANEGLPRRRVYGVDCFRRARLIARDPANGVNAVRRIAHVEALACVPAARCSEVAADRDGGRRERRRFSGSLHFGEYGACNKFLERKLDPNGDPVLVNGQLDRGRQLAYATIPSGDVDARDVALRTDGE